MNFDTTSFKKIVVLTGAGISSPSGLRTFRDSNGLWENHRVEEVATPEAFARDPLLVWKFYSMRRLDAARVEPNEAHKALVQFAQENKNKLTLITQNVDGLHQRADPQEVLRVIPMHGSLNESLCSHCLSVYFDDYAYFDLGGNYAPQETKLCTVSEKASPNYLHQFELKFKNFLPLSPCCGALIRPNIVWFGEIPLHMAEIERALKGCDLFMSIGTSGSVYPAAGFLRLSKDAGAKTVCINKEELPQNEWVDHFFLGDVTEIVPKFFNPKY